MTSVMNSELMLLAPQSVIIETQQCFLTLYF